MAMTEATIQPGYVLAAEQTPPAPPRTEWPKPGDAGFIAPPEFPEQNESILRSLGAVRQAMLDLEQSDSYRTFIARGNGQLNQETGLVEYSHTLTDSHGAILYVDPETNRLMEVYITEGNAEKDRTLNNSIVHARLKAGTPSRLSPDDIAALEVGCNMVFAHSASTTAQHEFSPQVRAAIWGIEIGETHTGLYLTEENRRKAPNVAVQLTAGMEDPAKGWESVYPVGRVHTVSATYTPWQFMGRAKDQVLATEVPVQSRSELKSGKTTLVEVVDVDGVTTVRWGAKTKRELVLNAATDMRHTEILSAAALEIGLLKNGLAQAK